MNFSRQSPAFDVLPSVLNTHLVESIFLQQYADSIYKPLRSSEIRVVELSPGAKSYPINCSLYHVSDAIHASLFARSGRLRKYKCLSYAWGNPELSGEIFLNGYPFYVTQNLKAALKRLRSRVETQVFWIDAICINQLDVAERTAQVGIMRDIYSTATQVVVYLGEPKVSLTKELRRIFKSSVSDEEARPEERAMCVHGPPESLLGKYSPSSDLFHLLYSLSVGAFSVDTGSAEHNHSATVKKLSNLLEALMKAPWWTRVWVVQEVSVSESILVMYGSATADWSLLIEIAANYSSIKSMNSLRGYPSDITKVLEPFSHVVNSLQSLRTSWRSGQRMDFYSLMQMFSGRDASDDRDRIYALVGLSTNKLLRTDYFLDAKEVFRQATLTVMNEKNQDKLDFLFGKPVSCKNKKLPSWIVDWSVAYDISDHRRSRITQGFDPTLGSQVCTEPQQSAGATRCHHPHHQHLDEVDKDGRREQNMSSFGQFLVEIGYVKGLLEVPLQERGILFRIFHVYQGSISYPLRLSDDRLVIPGLLVGKVHWISNDIAPSDNYGAVLWRWATSKRLAQTQPTSDLWSSFLRALCNDTPFVAQSGKHIEPILAEIGRTRPPIPDTLRDASDVEATHWLWNALEAAFPHQLDDRMAPASFKETLQCSIAERRLFSTTDQKSTFNRDGNPLIGLGPPSMKPGDEIYLLPGSKSMFVVRKRSQGWRMIGDCYVQGCMHGQILGAFRKRAIAYLTSRREALSVRRRVSKKLKLKWQSFQSAPEGSQMPEIVDDMIRPSQTLWAKDLLVLS